MKTTVPCLWPGSTIVCLASGPSLTPADVDSCRGHARVLAVKQTIALCPWADVLYSTGLDRSRWWQTEGPRLAWFQGQRFTLDPAAARWATVLEDFYGPYLTSLLLYARNSGAQAIELAWRLGARLIVLLGYDLQATGGQDHFFGAHAHGLRPPFERFVPYFAAMAPWFAAQGVRIVNATRETVLTVFPRLSLAEALR